MPVENEIKHVLSDPHGQLMEHMAEIFPAIDIDQFYVTENNRFRRSSFVNVVGRAVTKVEHAFKLPVDGRLLEIETEVSEDDFLLASGAAVERIVKRRFSFDEDDAHWDVDFIFDAADGHSGAVRLAVAEAEFPEGGTYRIPDFILYSLDFVVPPEHAARFSNRAISDPGRLSAALAEHGPILRRRTLESGWRVSGADQPPEDGWRLVQ